jgi:hypothetical protein
MVPVSTKLGTQTKKEGMLRSRSHRRVIGFPAPANGANNRNNAGSKQVVDRFGYQHRVSVTQGHSVNQQEATRSAAPKP